MTTKNSDRRYENGPFSAEDVQQIIEGTLLQDRIGEIIEKIDSDRRAKRQIKIAMNVHQESHNVSEEIQKAINGTGPDLSEEVLQIVRDSFGNKDINEGSRVDTEINVEGCPFWAFSIESDRNGANRIRVYSSTKIWESTPIDFLGEMVKLQGVISTLETNGYTHELNNDTIDSYEIIYEKKGVATSGIQAEIDLVRNIKI